MVNLLDKLGQNTLSEETWIKKSLLTEPAWRSMTFTDLYYKRCGYKQNKNKGKTIKPSKCLEKKQYMSF